MSKKEMIAMLLAGGQGSRLGILTTNEAKPALSFGGKFRIIDFPLSNCINSGIDTVGVLTQYQPMRLHAHIGIGIPWDLDRNNGGVSILPPYERSDASEWYSGTANAIYQNIRYIEVYDPEYVLILSGDHVYKMDYGLMLDFHKQKQADVTIASMSVDWKEAGRFGLMLTDDNRRVTEFEEKPEQPRSNIASMGIYIFTWKVLKSALQELAGQSHCDFGKHVIPYLFQKNAAIYAYKFNGYWKDVGTLPSYWEANMGLTDLIPEFNLYEEYWNIYTNSDRMEPLYLSEDAHVERSLIGEASDVYGSVYGSIIGTNVQIGKGSMIRDSIIMANSIIGENVTIDRSIIAENVSIGSGAVLGTGYEAPNCLNPSVYCGGLTTVAENSVIPAGVRIGKNTAIAGETGPEDYPGGALASGGVIIKAGEIR